MGILYTPDLQPRNLIDELEELDRIERAQERELRIAIEKTIHDFNRAYVLNQPVFEELHPALKSLSECESERRAETEDAEDYQGRL